MEVFFQCLPACGVGGLEGGDVDGEGIVDGEVLDEGGVDTLDILVAQEFGTAFLRRQLPGEEEPAPMLTLDSGTGESNPRP